MMDMTVTSPSARKDTSVVSLAFSALQTFRESLHLLGQLVGCAKQHSGKVPSTIKLYLSVQRNARFHMAIERDDAAERLARIDVLLAEAKRTMARIAPTDRSLIRQLTDQLDEMLNELLGRYDVARRRA
jgi:hypothetical protein